MKLPVLTGCAHGIIGLATLFFADVNAVRAGAERGFYTDAKMAIMRQNLEKYEWARREGDAIIARADKWLKYDDKKLRTLVPPPEAPRAVVPHEKGVVVDGEATRSWRVSFDKPWKLIRPSDGKEFPSNDFEAFLKSGCKDRSLLTGEFPDDGWGYQPRGENRKIWFVAHYAHDLARFHLLPALRDLSRAYLITDDARYAHACALLLWQMAEYYPDYFYEKQSRRGKEFNADYRGRLLNRIWEAHMVGAVAPPAYDAVRPAIDTDEVLMKSTGRPASEIRLHIETRLLRTMAGDIMDGAGRIEGNYGMHQAALLRISAALEHSPGRPNSSDMREFVWRNPRPRTAVQLGVEDALNNYIQRDGYLCESPYYNRWWVETLADICANMDAGIRAQILQIPRFNKMFTWPVRMTCAGEFFPALGDTGDFSHGLAVWGRYAFEPGWRWYRNPLCAQALLQINSQGEDAAVHDPITREPLARDLFSDPLPEKELAAATGGCSVPPGTTSELMTALGWASLQTGTASNFTALAVFYGYFAGHAHWDRLHLDLYSRRNALIPDMGYLGGTEAHRQAFVYHTVSHNTVMINALKQSKQRGRLHVYDPGNFAQMVEVSAEACYTDAKLYRRTLMLVDASPENAYVVDVFRVRGGHQHDWLAHGAPNAEFRSDLDFGAPAQNGTLAGTDVPYGYFYDDPRFTPDNEAKRYDEGRVPYWDYCGSGFQWLFNARETRLNMPGSINLHLRRAQKLVSGGTNEDVVLRAHLAGAHPDTAGETLYACDGLPLYPDKSVAMKFLVRRRAGVDLESVYVAVYEPYKNKPFIDSVRILPLEGKDLPVALEISLDSRKHVVFSRLETQEGHASSILKLPGGSVKIDARAAVLEQGPDGGFRKIYLLDNATSAGLEPMTPAARFGQADLAAEVKYVDYAKGEITLSRPIPEGLQPAGGTAIVESRAHAAAVAVARFVNRTTFAVGDGELAAGQMPAKKVNGKELVLEHAAPFVEPGMTLVDASGRVFGRVVSTRGASLVLDGELRGLEDLPADEQTGRRIVRIMVVGPGDRVGLHYALRKVE